MSKIADNGSYIEKINQTTVGETDHGAWDITPRSQESSPSEMAFMIISDYKVDSHEKPWRKGSPGKAREHFLMGD